MDEDNSRNIRQKFGLEYMISSGSAAGTKSVAAPATGSTADALFSGALIGVGGKLLSILKQAPAHQATVYDLVDQTGIDFEQILNILERLGKLDLIRYALRDKRGNHTIELTDYGESSSV